MLTAAQIKQIRSLREKKYRDEYGVFVVEGDKMVGEALKSRLEVLDVFKVEDIGQNTMSRISQLSSPSSILAVVRKPEKETVFPSEGLFLALDSVRDPGNMGTIIRLADWFGISAVFASEDSVEFFNPKVIQSSMGSVFRVKMSVASIPELCRSFSSSGLAVYGTFLDGKDIYKSDLKTNGLIVMGNESEGISSAVASEVNAKLLIPSFDGSGAESLNVATATAITLSEFRRR